MVGSSYVGRVLVEARRAADGTVAGMARALGVSRATVTAWEQGHSRPDALRYPEIESAYGLDAGLLASLYSDPRVSLDFWYGRAYQIERHLRRVLQEQSEYVRDMAAHVGAEELSHRAGGK